MHSDNPYTTRMGGPECRVCNSTNESVRVKGTHRVELSNGWMRAYNSERGLETRKEYR